MQPIKICYVVSRLVDGGPSNQLFYIIQNLPSDFEAVVVTLSPEPEETALPRYRQAGIEVLSLGLGRWNGLLHGGAALRRMVQRIQPDIIHSHGLRPDVLSSRHFSGLPRVSTVHNYAYEDYPMKFGRGKGHVMAWLHFRTFRGLEVPVACSHTIANKLKKHGLIIGTIQNGVDTNRFHLIGRAKKQQLRQHLGLPVDARIIVTVGSIISLKDPETVIRGFLASDRQPSDVLLVLGDGPLFSDCKALAAEYDADVRLPGHVSNVPDYLQASDVFISASHSEGLPNTVLEAMACGLPVCLSDIPPHREVFADSSSVPHFFDVGNYLAIADWLSNLSEKDAFRLSAQVAEIVETSFSAQSMSSQYQQLYASLVEQRGVPSLSTLQE